MLKNTNFKRWDTRKLNEPLESLLIDPIKSDDQVVSRSYGVTVLEYETTMPTKFMCGTDVGMVFVCNRKGKTPIEKINFRVSSSVLSMHSKCIKKNDKQIFDLIYLHRYQRIWDQFVQSQEIRVF